MEPESKLARLVGWVRQNMDSKGVFLKSAFYAYARKNDMERSALMFIFRCRKNGTFRDKGDTGIQVLVSKDKNLEQFYNKLLKIKGTPAPQSKPEPKPEPREQKIPEKEKLPEKILKPERLPKPEKSPNEQKEPEKPASRQETVSGVLDLANIVAERLEDRLKRMDDTVTSVSSLVEHRIDNLEKNVSRVIVQELEKRIKQLEKQLEEFREKAQAFDLIKRDAWEVVQALEMIDVERDDVKKVLKKFL